jgi:hypothetical protein
MLKLFQASFLARRGLSRGRCGGSQDGGGKPTSELVIQEHTAQTGGEDQAERSHGLSFLLIRSKR